MTQTPSVTTIGKGTGFCATAPGKRTSEPSGILVVDKPEGMTSFAVVAKVKKLLRIRKAGHCGTLDPFATGVLPVCLNQATRIVDQLLVQDKVYRCTIHFGIETDTLDRTGKVLRTIPCPPPPAEELQAAVSRFQGTYLQQVPRYAAVHVQGRRLYEWSRDGIEVEAPKREVQVYRIDLLEYRWPEATLEVHCAKGTYIRQLAADIGSVLGCGAHLTQLRRLASGSFDVASAVPLDTIEKISADQAFEGKMLSMNTALAHIPAVAIEEESLIDRLCDGYLDPAWQAGHRESFSLYRGPVRIVDTEDHLRALWWPHPEDAQGRRLRVFQY